MNDFDAEIHEIPCTCGYSVRKSVAWFKKQTTLTCPQCGQDMTSAMGDHLRGVEAAEKAVDEDLAKMRRGEV